MHKIKISLSNIEEKIEALLMQPNPTVFIFPSQLNLEKHHQSSVSMTINNVQNYLYEIRLEVTFVQILDDLEFRYFENICLSCW